MYAKNSCFDKIFDIRLMGTRLFLGFNCSRHAMSTYTEVELCQFKLYFQRPK